LDLAFDFCFAGRGFLVLDLTERIAFLAERFADFLAALATLPSFMKIELLSVDCEIAYQISDRLGS
jgi:hypothetical protein